MLATRSCRSSLHHKSNLGIPQGDGSENGSKRIVVEDHQGDVYRQCNTGKVLQLKYQRILLMLFERMLTTIGGIASACESLNALLSGRSCKVRGSCFRNVAASPWRKIASNESRFHSDGCRPASVESTSVSLVMCAC